MTAQATVPSALVAWARVRRTERISPASPEFTDLGVEGFDTRFKVVLPGPTGRLPEIPDVAEEWYAGLLAMPDDERSFMRTYTVRDVLVEDGEVLLVADFVVHEPADDAGPACRWALQAAPGGEVQVITPSRRAAEHGMAYGGTEFDPGERRSLLLAGDETTVPAVARILADLGPGFTGSVFLEVPTSQDILDLPVREGIDVHWLPRSGAACGGVLVDEVRRFLGLAPLPAEGTELEERPSDLDIDVWETPSYSSAGEDLDDRQPSACQQTLGSDLTDVYAWIAGESWAVKVLRRSLVSELGVDRGQVAFMGYWREGVAMRS